VITKAAAAGIRRHTGTYRAEAAQVGRARAALAGWLCLLESVLPEWGGWPPADEATLIASEFAANSVLHSVSRDGGAFTLRAEAGPGRLRIEVEDAGGPWHAGAVDDRRPHGFDVVAALAGPGNWGIDGDERGRTAWARLVRPGR
jgi:anti-sigma regulatory factor (Ser/Thr protein kinase)